MILRNCSVTILMTGVALAVAGCAVPSPQEKARLDGLIGHNETDLLRSFGVPSRTYSAQGHDFLAYSQGWSDVTPGFGPWGGYGGFGGWGGGFGGGYGGFGGGYGGFGGGYGGFGGIPPMINTYTCTTTFEVVGGRVAGWTIRGDGC